MAFVIGRKESEARVVVAMYRVQQSTYHRKTQSYTDIVRRTDQPQENGRCEVGDKRLRNNHVCRQYCSFSCFVLQLLVLADLHLSSAFVILC